MARPAAPYLPLIPVSSLFSFPLLSFPLLSSPLLSPTVTSPHLFPYMHYPKVLSKSYRSRQRCILRPVPPVQPRRLRIRARCAHGTVRCDPDHVCAQCKVTDCGSVLAEPLRGETVPFSLSLSLSLAPSATFPLLCFSPIRPSVFSFVLSPRFHLHAGWHGRWQYSQGFIDVAAEGQDAAGTKVGASAGRSTHWIFESSVLDLSFLSPSAPARDGKYPAGGHDAVAAQVC